jgi:two-component sensor histidine kinase
VTFNLDTAITCGLILNELISNCLKHAFPHTQTGHIEVSLQTVPPQDYQLIVRDDGVGIPADEALQTTGAIGLKLVSTLAQKLKAQLTIERGQGTTFVLQFPNVIA